jgi:hypothetical protein
LISVITEIIELSGFKSKPKWGGALRWAYSTVSGLEAWVLEAPVSAWAHNSARPSRKERANVAKGGRKHALAASGLQTRTERPRRRQEACFHSQQKLCSSLHAHT